MEPTEPTNAASKAASQKIAMTAPVALEPLPAAGQNGQGPQAMQGATRWRVHFVMPSAYTLDTLPKPNNTAVQLRQVPAKTWAVLSYSGFNTEAGIQRRTDELGAWLAARHGIQVHGAMGYTWEVDLQMFMKRAWALDASWGDRGLHKSRIADAMLADGAALGPGHTFEE